MRDDEDDIYPQAGEYSDIIPYSCAESRGNCNLRVYYFITGNQSLALFVIPSCKTTVYIKNLLETLFHVGIPDVRYNLQRGPI
jgi:hypothetical protein